MADRRKKYKQKGDNFGDLELSRISRVEKQDQRRKEIRSQNFSRLRPLEEITQSQTPGKSDSQITRNEKLEKWKKQKELKKKTEKKVVKKPPFKVGIVHHKIYSPPTYNSALPSCSHWNTNSQPKSKIPQTNTKIPQTNTTSIKRITRVTEKRLAAKAAKTAAEAAKNSFAPPNYKFKPPPGLANIPIFGRVRKGSMDVSTLSWIEKKASIKPAVSTYTPIQRKKSKSLSHDSPQKNKKLKISFSDQVKNSPKKTRLSKSREKLNSNSSNSSSLPTSCDDAEVFDSEIEDPVEEEMENSPAFTNIVEPLETSISPIKSSESFTKSPSNKSQIELEQESVNYSLKLQVSDLSDHHNNSLSKNELNNRSLQKQAKNLESVNEVNNFKPIEQYNSQDYSLKLQSTELSNLNNSKANEQELEKIINLSSELSDKSFNDTQNVAIYSPYVVTRRGKKEARKEQQLRRGFNHSLEEIPTKETVMQNLNISIDEEKRTSQYFRCLLESETNRLSEQCNSWDEIILNENPPEEVKEIIEQAIGQTRLLLRSKFMQFDGLVRQCEEGHEGHLVTCKDLQGFWDMMNVTVKNCEARFEKVKEIKENGWVENVKIIPTKKRLPLKKKSPKKKSPNKKAPVKSNLRAMILAARQKKKEIEENSEEKPNDEQVMEIWKNVVKESPTNVTTSTRRLSIAPQPASKERRMSFPRAAMMISQKRKTPENLNILPSLKSHEEDELYTEMETTSVQVHLDESISYINSRQTPGKSILKRIKIETYEADDSRLLRSTQKVNFNDNVELNEVEVDEETQNKQSLAASLARIDSMNFEDEFVPEVQIHAEKKLNFEDMSFNENPISDNVFEETKSNKEKTPDINIIAPTPKSKRLSDAEIIEENTRKLRSRKPILDSQNSIEKVKNKAVTPKSPKEIKKRKLNSTLDDSLVDKIKEKKTPKSPRLINKSKLNSDLENLHIDETKENKYTPKSPRLINKSKLNANLENLNIDEAKEKMTRKSPRIINKSKLNSDFETSLVDEIKEKKTPKSPRSNKKIKFNSDLENSLIDEIKEKKTPMSPRSIKKSKFNSSVNPSIIEQSHDDVIEDEDLFRRSLRNRTIIGNLTPKSQKKLNKENSVPDKLEKSPHVNDNNFELNSEISSQSPLDRENIVRTSKRILRSPILKLTSFKKRKSILTPRQQQVTENESVLQAEEESTRKTPRNMGKTKEFDKKVTPKVKNELESPIEKFVKLAKTLQKLVKTPINASKKAKVLSDETENMEVDFETELNQPLSRKGKKLRKTPKAGQREHDRENQEEDSPFKRESLHLSLVKRNNSETKNLRRSLKIPANEMHSEKENTSPGIFKRKSLISSPKPIETPSKRKSIKRSMSCHVNC
ncbi:uncharacterized protein LOC127279219 isoform X2 [Leptopilina boulardi]|uniref:uncharacterized protein LOC127279219 isoform X2 n=1 Tax=Leptopilina boulardi TaxID=63433 RepID=UPI0021F667B5|nr:uncharacterized protein LOC127279219 isoform X2 [Leptopilina boulardi]